LAIVGKEIFFEPPALRKEPIRQAGEGEMIREQVLFHGCMMPMAFADYVQTLRSYLGFCFGRFSYRFTITFSTLFWSWA
tara:strand:+ start:4812 stop:5048 length:237 start_codon:yes stop_codon:yes gene_type:complete